MSNARDFASRVPVDGALSNRNLIINGAMQVAQRGTTGLGSTTSAAYTLDRWFAYRGSVSQQFDFTTGKYALRWTYSSSNNSTSNFISQNIEDINCMHTRGQNVTLSFQVRVNANTWGATDFGYDIIQDTTANRNPNAISQTISNKVAVTTSWQTVTKTVTVGATTTNLCITFGRDYLTNVDNDWFEIRDVQLEIGDTPTPFEHRSYGDELAKCQRYYYQTGSYKQSVVSLTNIATLLWHSYAKGAGNWEFHDDSLPTTMRATPTLTYSDVAGTVGKISHATSTGGAYSNNHNAYSAYATTNVVRISDYSTGGIYGFGFEYAVDAEL